MHLGARSAVAILFFFAVGPLVPSFAHAAEIKVRIVQSQTSVSVTGLGIVLRGDNDAQARIEGMGAFVLKPTKVAGRVLWTMTDKASGRLINRLMGERVEMRGEMTRIDLKPAPGVVTFLAESARVVPTIDAIAAMDLETYLEGVLPQEMPVNWPVEALKAQAIASRSFALNRIRERIGKSFHVESTIMDQAFAWQDAAERRAEKYASVRQALKETQGIVLHDDGGSVVTAFFHADCGGRTEEAGAVWGLGMKTAGTAVDGGCPFSPKARWTWSTTREELTARLRPMLGLGGSTSVREISLQGLSGSGRVLMLALATDDGQTRKLSGHQLRALLGFDRLKSTAFHVEKTADGGFRFQGRGHGHGVGMCQWGSRKLASDGADYKAILKHYFPKARVVRLDDTLAAAASP